MRESVPYLQDAGWRETATLLIAAAAEIESLRASLSAATRVTCARGTPDRARGTPSAAQ
jgi:hypothetical protein